MSPELAAAMLEAIESELRGSLTFLDSHRAPEMVRMLRYHFGWGEPGGGPSGKRVRSLLTLLTCAAAGGDWKQALPGAAAIELIHNFSLLHDDIEDRSEYRRGRRTLWVEWGVPQGINSGDALFVLAHLSTYRLLESGLTPAACLDVRRILDEACLDLTRGQHQDIAFEEREAVTLEEYLQMIEGKTGALFAAAAGIGARVADADGGRFKAYRRFGLHLGLAFQVLDDLLGIWGSVEETGKEPGDDLRMRKKSFPVVLGLAESPAFRDRWVGEARDEAAVRAMIRLLEEAGVRSRTAAAAEKHTGHAQEALAEALPQGPAGGELESLTAKLLRRTA